MPLIKLVEPITQQWSITKIVTDRPPPTWEKLFKAAIPEVQEVDKQLEGLDFYPLKQDLFRAFDLVPIDKVKVIIIGQDPYFQTVRLGNKMVPRATGVAFSVRKEDEIPVSLNCMITELANTIKGFKAPTNGDLEHWCHQGVLLLNSCLTVQPGTAGAHGRVWLGFIQKVVTGLLELNPKIIVLLWGGQAKELENILNNRCTVLTAAHPADRMKRFIGCGHFPAVNELLKKRQLPEIDWLMQ